MRYKTGQLVMIAKNNDNDNYDKYRGLILEIVKVSTNEEDHPGYDSSMIGEGLNDLHVFETGEPVPFSLYDYELELAN